MKKKIKTTTNKLFRSQVSYTMNCKSKSSYEVIYNNNNENTVLHWSNWRPFKNVNKYL